MLVRSICSTIRNVAGNLSLPTSLHLRASPRWIQTTSSKHGLMEFFDDEKNWGKNYIKHGRAWKKEELRIKSNSDLHKLWFVLLKEKNMLLTMEHECKIYAELFPSPERIDKVEESMSNLETVVRERNEAYHYLETGETGERPQMSVINAFGDNVKYKASEHIIPEAINKAYRQKYMRFRIDKFGYQFQQLMNEKSLKRSEQRKLYDRQQVYQLLKRFPDVDMEALKEKYPDVEIDKVKAKVDSYFNTNWENRDT